MNDGTGQDRIGSLLDDETLESVVATMGDVILVLDGDGTIQTAVGTETTLGYPPEQLVGSSIATLLSMDLPPVLDFDITTAQELQATVSGRGAEHPTVPFGTVDGAIVPLTLSIVSRDGDHICVGQETTGQLGHTHTDLRDAIADPIYVLDAENCFRRVNDAMVERTGYDREALLGREFSDIVPASSYDRITPHMAGEVDGSEAERIEMTVVTADGEPILTEAHVTVISDESGAYAGSVGVLREIRERKRHEQDLELLKQVLTRVFRHNIRNELMVTKTHAEVLADRIDPELHTHTKEIQQSADRLLDYSEKARFIKEVIETQERYEFDITSAVEEVVEPARERNPAASITLELPAGVSVQAHPHIDKALEELVGNAIEHAPDADAQLQIWIDREGASETLFIEDESGGLAEEEIRVLRSGSEDTLEHGSGVGLWLVRWLVDYSGAELIVHRTDEGTLVGIRFDHTETPDIDESPLTSAPERVRDISPESFHGETVIGRVEILEQLETIYGDLERKGSQTVLLTGEAGIGKSTLVEQFRERLAEQDQPPIVATGFCEKDVQPPYHAFRQVVRELPGERELAELLADAASLSATDADRVAQRKRGLFADIAEQLRTVSENNPVVLLVEDMQWADRGTIELFEYLTEEVGRWGHRVLFLGTYRTSDVEQSHPVLEITTETAETGRGTIIDLEPFDESEIRLLLSDILEIEEIPGPFVEAVSDHTGGTPLFVTELGRHLAETVGPVQSGAALPESLDTVPQTVEHAITERLETVPEAVQPVLGLGAVIGREFSFDVLRAASEQRVGELVRAIDTLVDRQIWTRSGGDIEFVHGVVREQTLTGIPDEDRNRFHSRVAEAIESVHAGEIDEHAARLANHYEQIGEDDTAFEFYRQAGAHAAETYANEDAVDHYERARSLAERDEQIDRNALAAVLTELGDLHGLRGEHDTSHALHEQSLDLSRDIDDSEGIAKSLNDLAGIAYNQGELDRGREYAEESLELYRDRGDRNGEADCLTTLGDIASGQGEYDTGREYYEQSLAIFREISDRYGTAKNLQKLGIIEWRHSEYDQAREYYEQSLTILRELGDRPGEAGCLNNLGLIASNRGRYEQARDYYEQSLEISREIGNRDYVARTLSNLGGVAGKQGAYDRAREYYEEGLTILREIGDRNGEAGCLNGLGDILGRLGQYEQARTYLEQSLDISREIGRPRSQAESLHNLGHIDRRQGKYGTASDRFEEALDIFREIGDRRSEARTLNGLGVLAYRRGAVDRAREYLTEAREIATAIDASEAEIISLRGLGAVAREEGVYEQAADDLQDSLGLCEETESRHQSARTRLEDTRLAIEQGNRRSARESVGRAEKITSELGTPHDQARARLLSGRIAAASDSPDAASTHWQQALEAFERVGAPHDTLTTLQHLADHDAADADRWVEKATAVFEDAPEPVKRQHRGWLSDRVAEIE